MTLQNTKTLSLDHYFKSEPNRDKLNKELKANSKDKGYEFFVSAMRFYVKAGIALYFGFLLTPRNSIQGFSQVFGLAFLTLGAIFMALSAVNLSQEGQAWSLLFPGNFSFLKEQFDIFLSYPDAKTYLIGGAIFFSFVFLIVVGKRR